MKKKTERHHKACIIIHYIKISMSMTPCTFIKLSIINSVIGKQFKILPDEILKINTLQGMCLNAELHPICACEIEVNIANQTCLMLSWHRDLTTFKISWLAKALQAKGFLIKMFDETIAFDFFLLILYFFFGNKHKNFD